MTHKEALTLALYALEDNFDIWIAKTKAITAIKEALAQPSGSVEQEPVAKVCHDLDGHIGWNPKLTQLPDEGTPLYTTTPPVTESHKRKPLTDEQIDFLNFLYGAGEWDGIWFEGKHPTKKGAFWWREDMKRLFDYNKEK